MGQRRSYGTVLMKSFSDGYLTPIPMVKNVRHRTTFTNRSSSIIHTLSALLLTIARQRNRRSVGARWQYSSGTSAVPLHTLLSIQDPVTLGMHPVLSDVAGAIAPTEFQAYHRLDFRFSQKTTLWGLPVTTFTEIWNVYSSPNRTRFNFADRLVEEINAEEFENEEEFPLDLESAEYKSPIRFPFNLSFGLIYEF